MHTWNKFIVFILAALIFSNIFWSLEYVTQRKRIENLDNKISAIKQSKNILIFQKIFVEKVLKANGEVDFDTRVELQNAVNAIADEDITAIWNSLLSSKDEEEGQEKVKALLSLLAEKALPKD